MSPDGIPNSYDDALVAQNSVPVGDYVLVLIPLFNDWDASRLLLALLDATLRQAGIAADVLIIDDGSTLARDAGYPGTRFQAIRRIEVLRLRRNLGHQRAIAVGLAYVEQHRPCRVVVLMDSDGEDAPADVPRLLERFAQEGGTKIIFAERTRRSESWVFILFYALFKIMHVLLTGQGVRVGNFSAIPRDRLSSLVVVSELWNHYPAAVFRSRQPLAMVPTRRGKRLMGRSQMNFTRLVVHGLSALSVYSDIIGVRLLLGSMALIGVAGLGLLTVLGIRLTTSMAIPGWATNSFGLILVILLQAVMFSVLFSFIILGGRQGSSFLPSKGYVDYIGEVTTVHGGPTSASAVDFAAPVREP